MRVFDGGCLCERIRYRSEGEPVLVDYCHCAKCRKASGAPVLAWAAFERTRVHFSGDKPALFESSPHTFRYFCPRCGSALAMGSEGETLMGVTVGTLDHPEELPPRQHSWVASRLPWLVFHDDLPEHAGESPELAGEEP